MERRYFQYGALMWLEQMAVDMKAGLVEYAFDCLVNYFNYLKLDSKYLKLDSKEL